MLSTFITTTINNNKDQGKLMRMTRYHFYKHSYDDIYTYL